jgi:hypothetical protein
VIARLHKAWQLAKGHRLKPWNSPYLRWRIETWSGVDADSITPAGFLKFVWRSRSDLFRYLGWAARRG